MLFKPLLSSFFDVPSFQIHVSLGHNFFFVSVGALELDLL